MVMLVPHDSGRVPAVRLGRFLRVILVSADGAALLLHEGSEEEDDEEEEEVDAALAASGKAP